MPKSEEQRTIELIEDSPFSPQDKYKLLLVHLGARQACTVSIASGIWRRGGDAKEIDTERVLDANQTLQHISAVYEANQPLTNQALPTAPKKQGKRLQEVMTFLVARELNLLVKLKQAIRANDYVNLGYLYSWPRTSIDAVTYEGVIALNRLATATIMTDPVRFLDFPLSQQNWPSELARVQDWVNLVQRNSPVIYQQLRMANFCRLNDEQVDGMFGRLERRGHDIGRQTG